MKIQKILGIIAGIFAIKKSQKEHTVKITDVDDDVEILQIDKIGVTNIGTGVVIFKTGDGKEFPISAFSVETAKTISEFHEGKTHEIPSIHNMVEQICEELEIQLVKVRIYSVGDALRANLYFTGKKDMILRNYRSSDAIALATLYKIPVLIKKELLEQNAQIKTK